jgi:hypothetical protein
MHRLASTFAVLAGVLLSSPAFACGHHHGVQVGIGPLYLSLGHYHPCEEVVMAPPVVYVPAPMVVVPAPVAVAVATPMYVEEEPMMPPPMVVAPAPMVIAVPPPPAVVVAPVAPPAPPMVAAPVVVAPAVVVAPPDEVQRVAVKWMPGFSAPIDTDKKALGQPIIGQNFGLEYRLSHYWALRGDLEMHSGAMSIDVPGIKFSLLPHSRVRPFASVGLSLGKNAADPTDSIAVGFVGAAGLDIILFKYVFLTGEVRYRNYPSDCCSLPRVSGLVGIGAQFL